MKFDQKIKYFIHGIERRIKNVKLFPFIPFSLAHSPPKLSSNLIFIIHRLLVLLLSRFISFLGVKELTDINKTAARSQERIHFS